MFDLDNIACSSSMPSKNRHDAISPIFSLLIYSPLGSEKDFVIISLVRSLPDSQIEHEPSRGWLSQKLGFVTDEHQINVAITRAKRGLCIIGKMT